METKTAIKKEQNGITILLVDDDAFLLDMYSLKFKNAGYDVTTIDDPSSALERIKGGENPDIILFDLVMPNIGGWGFIEAIRKEKLVPDATVIILSNQSQQSDFDLSKQYSVDGYVVKALSTPTEVLQQVQEIHTNKNKK
jgi:CheY-like chemotaxis protein